MSRRIAKTDEPSRASLAEMPEVDFSRLGKLSRGKYAERARGERAGFVADVLPSGQDGAARTPAPDAALAARGLAERAGFEPAAGF